MSAFLLPTFLLTAAFMAGHFPSFSSPISLLARTLVVGAVAFLASYLVMPTVALDGSAIYLLMFFFAVIGFILRDVFRDSKAGSDLHVGLGIAGALVLTIGVWFVSTSAMLHADKYRNILSVESTETFEPSDILLDQSQARFVDQKLASRAGQEVLGGQLGMGSRYKIGTMSIQQVDGELVWVAPFGHKSFWKWLFDGPSVPGYLKVSSRNFGDAKMVTEDVDINYGTQGFFGSNSLERLLYTEGYSHAHLTDYTMELDDEGKPMWVVSRLEKTVGNMGSKVISAIIVDANTGEHTEFEIDEVPSWVDRVQPEAVIVTQMDDWGSYVEGWVNSVFVGNQVVESTPGTSLVYSKDGRPMWYTGVQSNGTNQQGTMGFMLVDTRTGVAKFYRRAGITETVAMTAIEGRVQEYDYTASIPIPYNVNGMSTFISVLKDKQGNPQMIGMVAYDNRSLNAVGEDLHTVTRRYQLALTNANASNNVKAGQDEIEIQGVIIRLGTQQVDESASIHFMIDTPEWAGKIFTANTGRNVQTVLTEKNDRVKFKVNQTKPDQIIVRDFENLSL